MLESELYDRENRDKAGGGRAAGELNAPAPSVPAAVFQPPPVAFQPPAIRPEPAPVTTPPRASTRPAGPPPDPAGLPATAAGAAAPPAPGHAAGHRRQCSGTRAAPPRRR